MGDVLKKHKVVVQCHYYYDYTEVSDKGLLVPEDFDYQKEYTRWREEAFVFAKGRNQYGEWTSKYYGREKVSFFDWLRQQYQEVEVVQVE